jgi:phosphatidylinositol glycan class O
MSTILNANFCFDYLRRRRIFHVLGIFLFLSGFLLTRLVLDHKSECAVPPIPLGSSYTPGSPNNGCWHPKSFDKAVVIIVDALRYDFTVPWSPKHPQHISQHFHNALPIFWDTAVAEPQNAFLLPFIADPPTTTLQRLKGLTTGTLPTFIDAGSNFAGTAIEEDNLVAQLKAAGKRIVHLGDDTWHSLFPGYFDPELTRAYDSFNVWDLHTVDNGVNDHIFPLLHSSNTSSWDIIFGHYLGVDHAGHRYGPDHPAMASKLQEMNGVFERMIAALDDKTLLVVMGDHGMDAKGDHGGESDDEVEAALWMFSKQGLFGRRDESAAKPPYTAKERPVAQIDLVPTLSLLLGMPIPFNNLGQPIEEAFIGKNNNDWENLAQVSHLTAGQIHRYQKEYSAVRKLDSASTLPPETMWEAASRVWHEVGQTKKPSVELWQAAYSQYHAYQQENLRVCKSLWARFDLTSMAMGIALLTGALLTIVLFANGFSGDRGEIVSDLCIRGVIGTAIGAGAGLLLGGLLDQLDRLLLWLEWHFGHALVLCINTFKASCTTPYLFLGLDLHYSACPSLHRVCFKLFHNLGGRDLAVHALLDWCIDACLLLTPAEPPGASAWLVAFIVFHRVDPTRISFPSLSRRANAFLQINLLRLCHFFDLGLVAAYYPVHHRRYSAKRNSRLLCSY